VFGSGALCFVGKPYFPFSAPSPRLPPYCTTTFFIIKSVYF